MSFCIALAERYSNRFMSYQKLEEAELAGGRVALAALARVQLEQGAGTGGGGGNHVVPVWAT